MMQFLSTKRVITGMLGLQLVFAAILVGRDMSAVWPSINWPSTQPAFDKPVLPGDQTRRYHSNNMPLSPSRDGNTNRPYRSTSDMPDRLTFTRDGDELIMTGAIAAGDSERVIEQLDNDLTRVRLNSPGGSVQDALAIGKKLRDLELSTVLKAGDICLSACPYIFASGTQRRVHDDALIGVHQHYFGANSALPAFLAVELIQNGQAEVMIHLSEMGVDPLIMQHALTTPSNEIYVLLPEQLTEYHLTTELQE